MKFVMCNTYHVVPLVVHYQPHLELLLSNQSIIKHLIYFAESNLHCSWYRLLFCTWLNMNRHANPFASTQQREGWIYFKQSCQ